MASSVKVSVRLRPLTSREKKKDTIPAVMANTEKKEINVVKGLETKATRHGFHFDNVFGEYATQEEIFEATLMPLVDQVLQGFEATVFAYGQTGTGKTYTMEGDITKEKERGVIPRSCEAIFEHLKNSGRYSNFMVKVSYLEIYNEELADLLVENGSKLKVCEQKNGKIHCMGLTEKRVTSTEEITTVISSAQQRRQVAETKMNRASSRSHCLFTLRVKSKEKVADGIVEREGKLHLVDLAGSECAKSTGADAARFRESQNINKSLLTLGRVITALRDNLPRIPYRDSKLTRLLQEALGGQCQTLIIATLSPSISCVDESLSTLTYAEQAKGIVNKPVTAQVRMQTLGGGVGGHGSENSASRESFAQMEQRMLYLQSQCSEAQAALGRKHEEVNKLQIRAEEAESKNEDMKNAVAAAEHNLEEAKKQNHKIHEELQQAMHTIVCRDKLIESRKETETKLTSEAKALIGSLQQNVATMGKMQEDIVWRSERAKEVQDKAKMFYAALIDKFNTLQTQTSEFENAHRDASSALKGCVKKASVEGQKVQGSILKSITERQAQLNVDFATNAKNMSEFCDGHSLSVDKAKNDVDSYDHKIKDNIISMKQSVKKEMETVQSIVAEHGEALQNWVKEAHAFSQAAESEIAILLGVGRETLKSYSQEHSAQIDTNTASLKKMTNDLQTLDEKINRGMLLEKEHVHMLETDHGMLQKAITKQLDMLATQNVTISAALKEASSAKEQLEKCSNNAFQVCIKDLKEHAQQFIQLFETEEEKLLSALCEHRKGGLPKWKMILDHVQDATSNLDNRANQEVAHLSTECENLNSVRNAKNMLGSSKNHQESQSMRLQNLKSFVDKAASEEIEVLKTQHGLLKQTIQAHMAGGATKTENAHAETLAACEDAFQQKVNGHIDQLHTQQTHLNDMISFQEHSRKSRVSSATGIVQQTQNHVNEHTSVAQKLLEEQRAIFEASLKEHKMKQENIVTTVIGAMQGLLQSQMNDMTTMFAEKMASLEEKANEMETNTLEMSKNLVNDAGLIVQNTDTWRDDCDKTMEMLQSTMSENDAMQISVNVLTETVDRQFKQLKTETKLWGECGRQIQQNMEMAVQRNVGMSENILAKNANASQQIQEVQDEVKIWGAADDEARKNIVSIVGKIDELSNDIKGSKKARSEYFSMVTSEANAWGKSNEIVESKLSSLSENLSSIKKLSQKGNDELEGTMHGQSKEISCVVESTVALLTQTITKVQTENKACKDGEIEIQNTISQSFQKSCESMAEAQETSAENYALAKDILKENKFAIGAYGKVQSNLQEFVLESEHMYEHSQNALIDFHAQHVERLEEISDSMAPFLDKISGIVDSANDTVQTIDKNMTSLGNAHKDFIGSYLAEEESRMSALFDQHSTFIATTGDKLGLFVTDITNQTKAHQDVVQSLFETHTQLVDDTLVQPAGEFSKALTVAVTSSVELSDTFCKEDVCMDNAVVTVEPLSIAPFSEDLSRTPDDSSILVGMQYVQDVPAAPSTELQLLAPPEEEEKEEIDLATPHKVREEPENIVPGLASGFGGLGIKTATKNTKETRSKSTVKKGLGSKNLVNTPIKQ
jgi:kinesin family protein 11